MTIAIPTVHLNGSNKRALLRQICEAIDALHEAGKKLAAAAPNARDYYVTGLRGICNAQDQHEIRMRKLREIIAELEQIGEGILDQGSN